MVEASSARGPMRRAALGEKKRHEQSYYLHVTSGVVRNFSQLHQTWI